MQNYKGLFSEPTLTIISINIEGITKNKQDILSQLCQTTNCNILCIQEAHRDENSIRPDVTGMNLSIEAPHNKYGSAIFTKPSLAISSVAKNIQDDIETLTVEIGKLTVTSIYKPPRKEYRFSQTNNFQTKNTKFVIGDFNSHHSGWGYDHNDSNGDLVEQWAVSNGLSLIHDPKKRGYNPDLCFASGNIEQQCTKVVYNAIPKTQHRPIGINIYNAIKTPIIPFRRRFNFKKANWNAFTETLDNKIHTIEPTPNNYDVFVGLVKRISKKHIPEVADSSTYPE
ncbi:hypothetical protein HUJ05_000247 [Dendroctonus ponderosae]|nr:hypothetical protein HUJ05_000247 [Dendroctonus ponderosae]